MISLRIFIFFAVFATILSIAPAVSMALRGVQETEKTYSDCIGSGGLMKTELIDSATPSTYDPTYVEIKDSSNNPHGVRSTSEAEIDANSYGAIDPYIDFAPGSDEGNASGNSRMHEFDGSVEDDGQFQVKGTCTDCPYGRWTAVVKQRLWKQINVTWTPAGNEEGDQIPTWEYYVRSTDIKGQANFLYLASEYDSSSGANTIAAESDANGGFNDAEVTVGDQTEYIDTYWQDDDWNWSPNDSIEITIESHWDVDRDFVFNCDETTSHPTDEVSAELEWNQSIEDQTSPVAPLNIDQRSSIEAQLEYGSLIMLWSITVTYNCDATYTDCPCSKFQETDPSTPDTP